MILKENLSQIVDTTGVDLQGTQYGIAAKDMGMAIRAFYQYADAISSIVRELTSNGFDSNREAELIPGCTDNQLRKLGYTGDLTELRKYFSAWKSQDVIVTVKEGNLLTGDTMQIEFEDTGVGLSPSRMKNVFTNFFASTKRDSNDYIGAFGLGSKSPLGYCDLFLITTVFFGKKYSYAVHASTAAPELKLLSTEDTDELNGSVFSIPIKNSRDLELFRKAVCKQLMYFDGLVIKGVPNYNPDAIMKGKHFIYREGSDENLHICLGKVYYPIDFAHFNFGNRAWLPVALHFNVGDLDVVWNRESIEYTAETIDAIEAKAQLLKAELQALWDDENDDINDIQALYEASKNLSSGSMTIDGMLIPDTGDWLTRDVIYTPYPEMGRFSNDQFLRHCMKIDRVVIEGKTKQVSWPRIEFFEDPCFLWEARQKSDPFINRYVYLEKDCAKFHLISWKDPLEAAESIYATTKRFTTSGGANYDPWTSISDDLKNIFVQFVADIMLHMKGVFGVYDRSIIPQDWIDEQKETRKEALKQRRLDIAAGITPGVDTAGVTEMSYRYLYNHISYGQQYQGAHRGRVIFNNMHGSQLGIWLKNKLPVIYGSDDDKEDLYALLAMLRSNISNVNVHTGHSKTTKHYKGSPLFILVAKPNRKYMSTYAHAYTVSQYRAKLKNFLIEIKTSKLIEDHVNKLISPTATMMGLIPEYKTLYTYLQAFISNYSRHAQGEFWNFRKDSTPINMDVVNKLKQATAITRRYPLLAHINTASLDNASSEVVAEFDKYLSDKGAVSPDLYMRLAQFKKKQAKSA